MTAMDRVRVWTHNILNRPSPIVKQSATLGAVVAAVLIIALVPDVSMNYPALAWTGVAVVGFATVLAVVLSRVHEWHRFALLVPVIDIFAIGAFRGGTGGVMSPFTALIVLPVVWLASGNGRRYILYSGVGTFLALLIP